MSDRRSTSGALVAGGVALAIALVAVVAWVVLSGEDEAGATVRLEVASDVGSDPFTESVQIGPAVAFPANVEAVNVSIRGDLPADPDLGTKAADGTTPGLYGGTGETAVCDPDALVEFLRGEPRKARAWASVAGVDPERIEEFVAALTPVVLTSDTYVTNHGFRDGRATAFPAVLQAGTAVLVDASGLPRVKCNCGNPLAAPPARSLRGAATEGTAWSGFTDATVVTVRSAPSTGSLTLTDLTSGAPLEVPVGGGGVGQWVVARYGDTGTALLTSSDGTEWSEVATAPDLQIRSLAWDGDRWVALANRFGERVDPTLVLSSPDLRSWTELSEIPAAVDDIAWGDGRFVAVGTGAFGSADGVSWAPIPIAGPPDLGPGRFNAVVHAPEGWVASHVYSEFIDGGVRHLLVSGDGISPFDADPGVEPLEVGAGNRAAMAASDHVVAVAAERVTLPNPPVGALTSGLQAGADPSSLADVASPFDDTPADGMAWGPTGWLAYSGGDADQPNGDTAEPRRTTFFASDDARAWTEVGRIEGELTAVAWGGRATAAAPDEAPASGGDLRAVDWSRRTYRLDDCPDGGVEKALAGQDWISADGFAGVRIAAVTYGDVTGDGAEEALVYFECYAVGGNAFPAQVSLVFTAGDDGPTQLGGGIVGGSPVIDGAGVRTTSQEWVDGDPRCCPSRTVVTTWRLVDGEWVGG